ncbi:alpha/beta hydrolase [Alteromonas sp. ASW11-36]|uniref:Alpha/beta hydrolase n=1 Tax=Alteromonas arenosi TaxID=3055817 RepID=A0ABT7SY02_9ALTE|nr:alpha/beta hydrolase [Alteromonas sp. ASW11-36]MDM7861069.1 alpha/beta hydrolase [Alteromonas sp. ASW11-36]
MLRKIVSALSLSLILISAHLSATPLVSRYLMNVAFSDVTALEYREPTNTIVYGQHTSQFIEVWASKNRAAVEPLSVGIVLIHGGCWLKEYGVDHVRPLATALSDKGYNVFAVEYRRTGEDGGGWPGSLNDVNEAIYAVRQQYPRMSLTAVGHSAGGHLAMLAATDPRLRLGALIGLAAITDIETYAQGENGCQQAALRFIGEQDEQFEARMDAANTLDKNILPPLYLLTGDADSIVPAAQNRHPQAKRFVGEGIGHFDWIHPDSEAYQRLLNTLSRLHE